MAGDRLPTPAMAERQAWAVGDIVLYGKGGPEGTGKATVCFVGIAPDPQFKGRSIVGMEFCKDGFGQHDGKIPASGFRGFSCPPGRGSYTYADDPGLTRAVAQSEHDVGAMGTNLEERIESDVLQQKAQLAHAVGVLALQGHVTKGAYSQGKGGAVGRVPSTASVCSVSTFTSDATMAPQGCMSRMLLCLGSDGSSSKPQYLGPHLEGIEDGEVSEAEAKAMFEHAAQHPDVPLRADYLLSLVSRATAIFRKEPTLVRVSVPSGGRVLTLGDTHGHLKDIIHVFRKLGLPSATNVYLINGDISDRGDTECRGGQNGLAIWAVVLCFKVMCPGCLYFNRGNHEDWALNVVEGPYGDGSFHAEVHRRYPKKAAVLKRAFRELFYSTPIATVIGGKVLVLHGGIWSAGFEQGVKRPAKPVRLSEVELVKASERRIDIPSRASSRVDMIMMQATWNDPHNGDGVRKNVRGEGIWYFGGDVTTALCKQEGLSLVVRSHDWPQRNPPHGYEWWQKNHGSDIPKLRNQRAICMTIFTASDYAGETGSMGACIIFTGENGQAEEMNMVEWTAAEAMRTWKGVESQDQSPANVRRRSTAMAKSILTQVKARILEFKHQLFEEFKRKDTCGDSHVPVTSFIGVLGQILGKGPWESLLNDDPAHGIASRVATEPPSVNYMEFLSRYQIRFRNNMGKHAGCGRDIAAKMYHKLLLSDQPILSTLAKIDASGDGRVSVDELHTVIQDIMGSVSVEESRTMLHTVGGSGALAEVSVNDFLGNFRSRFASLHGRPAPPDSPWIPGACIQIGIEMSQQFEQKQQQQKEEQDELDFTSSCSVSKDRHLKDFFMTVDDDHSGYLEWPELETALRALPSCRDLSKDHMKALMKHCDRTEDGRLNYLEFLDAFSVDDNKEMADHLDEDNFEFISRTLYFSLKGVVSQVLEREIVPGKQRCTADEFVRALKAVNTLQNLLSEDQISVLSDTLDVDSDGRFDFRTFFASFEIIDTHIEGADFEEREKSK